MQLFNNILVGIDFSQLVDAEKAEFKPPVEQAIKWAVWLSQQHSARVTFFTSLELQGEFWSFLGGDDQKRLNDEAQTTAEQVMAKVVERAREATVQAESKIVHGKGWIELVRETVDGKHDLVIVGTRDVGNVNRLLFGTTAMKLIKECPVPVWVARPQPQLELQRVLVAVDLSPMCSRVVELALALQKLGARAVELLHVVDFPLDPFWSPNVLSEDTVEYHNKIRREAEKRLTDELKRQCDGDIPSNVNLHVADGSSSPGPSIRHYIEKHPVDLLVMGTVARHGVGGFFLGGTAEWLLPQIPCSLIAIKPADFQTRIPSE